jgi:hypothetical protein
MLWLLSPSLMMGLSHTALPHCRSPKYKIMQFRNTIHTNCNFPNYGNMQTCNFPKYTNVSNNTNNAKSTVVAPVFAFIYTV